MTEISYCLVSMGVALRDYIEPDYLNEEHEALCDLADTIQATGMTPKTNPEFYRPEFQDLYAKVSEHYWELVMADLRGLKSQLTPNNKADLILDYENLMATWRTLH